MATATHTHVDIDPLVRIKLPDHDRAMIQEYLTEAHSKKERPEVARLADAFAAEEPTLTLSAANLVLETLAASSMTGTPDLDRQQERLDLLVGLSTVVRSQEQLALHGRVTVTLAHKEIQLLRDCLEQMRIEHRQHGGFQAAGQYESLLQKLAPAPAEQYRFVLDQEELRMAIVAAAQYQRPRDWTLPVTSAEDIRPKPWLDLAAKLTDYMLP